MVIEDIDSAVTIEQASSLEEIFESVSIHETAYLRICLKWNSLTVSRLWMSLDFLQKTRRKKIVRESKIPLR